jgi:hypothetical protein
VVKRFGVAEDGTKLDFFQNLRGYAGCCSASFQKLGTAARKPATQDSMNLTWSV